MRKEKGIIKIKQTYIIRTNGLKLIDRIIILIMAASTDEEMRVLKRNGKYENIGFDKILKRVKSIGQECGIKLNYTTFVMKVIDQL